MWKSFQNVRFRNKLAIFYILVALVPFLVFAAIGGSFFFAQARESAVQHTAQITIQASNSIDTYISSIDKLAQNWAFYIQREKIADIHARDSGWKSAENAIVRYMKNNADSHREVAGILIAFNDDRYVSTGITRISSDPFTGESWYQLAAENLGKFVLISSATGRNIVTTGDYSVDNVFSLVRAVPDPVTGEVSAVVLFDVRHDIIMDSINQATIGNQGFAFVLDSNNEMVYTPMNDVVYRVNPIYLHDEAPVTMSIRDGSYHIRTCQSGYTGWKTVGVFSMNEVFSRVNALYPLLAFFVFAVIVLVITVSFGIASSVTKPISKMQKLMKTAESGDLSVRFNNLYEDEIGDLGRSFNNMIERIDHLISRVYQEQQRKRDAELKSLQEQIKPHFLYNTLDTISWMARDYGAVDIVKLIDALTNMFRIGLSHGKDFISVREEVTHVSNYLYIQKIRYRDKLNYDIRIDEDIYPFEVSKLILQPLIENAIYHGVKQKRGGGTVVVRGIQTDETTLRFSVEDDGVGLSSEKLAELRGHLRQVSQTEERQSFGLFYVAERIKLCYGDEYGIDIDSTEGMGTCVSVTVPVRREHHV